MKLFKEWFKAPKNADSLSAQELSKKQATLQAEAHTLEKFARAQLRGKNQEYLESIDPEFQVWLMSKYPKTNDDSLANDYAYSLIIDGYETIERDEQYDAEMKKTIDSLFAATTRQYEDLVRRQEHVRSLQKKLYDYQNAQRQLQSVLRSQQVQGFAASDDFYSYKGAEVLDTEGVFEAEIKREIDEASEELYQKNKAYRDAYNRWQALTRQDETTLDRFEANN